jgi:hypothetical protein
MGGGWNGDSMDDIRVYCEASFDLRGICRTSPFAGRTANLGLLNRSDTIKNGYCKKHEDEGCGRKKYGVLSLMLCSGWKLSGGH